MRFESSDMVSSILPFIRFRTVCCLILAMLLASCLPSGEDFANQSPLLAALERKSGLIAYAGSDGNIYTIDQGGGNQRSITSDAALPTGSASDSASQIYMFPTWSRDSSKLAFARFRSASGGDTAAAIYSAGFDGSDLLEIFSSDFAQPIYLNWAPNDEKLSFLASTPEGDLLLHSVPARGGETRLLEAGQPLYYSWAPDGQHLLVHVGSGSGSARLAYITLQNNIVESVLDHKPALFQAPAWNVTDDRIVFVGEGEQDESELLLADSQGTVEKRLAAVSGAGSVAFARSRDGKKIAYTQAELDQTQGTLGEMTVLNLDEIDDPIATIEDQVYAFFWSPDSDKLAYFVPRRTSAGSGAEESEQIILLEMHVLDAGDGQSVLINTFLPSNEFFAMLSFFDQYHNSATIWSPDSKNLVITAFTGQEDAQVLVINASGDLEPRPVASGQIAFWSWQ